MEMVYSEGRPSGWRYLRHTKRQQVVSRTGPSEAESTWFWLKAPSSLSSAREKQLLQRCSSVPPRTWNFHPLQPDLMFHTADGP